MNPSNQRNAKTTSAACAGLLIFALTAALAGQGTREVPDAVFYNGKVITVDSSNSIKEAFAVKGDKFLAVGTTREMRALAGSQTRLVDLKGKAVMPGLMDNHNHAYHAATANRGIDLKEASSLAALLDGVQKAAVAAGPYRFLLSVVGQDWGKIIAGRPGGREQAIQNPGSRPLVEPRSLRAGASKLVAPSRYFDVPRLDLAAAHRYMCATFRQAVSFASSERPRFRLSH